MHQEIVASESTCAVILLGIAFLSSFCSSSHAPIANQQSLPAELTIDPTVLRGAEGELYVKGKTTFPEGMKMRVYFGNPEVIASDQDITIHNSTFSTRSLWQEVQNPYWWVGYRRGIGPKAKIRNKPITNGTYTIRFEAYLKRGWQEPD